MLYGMYAGFGDAANCTYGSRSQCSSTSPLVLLVPAALGLGAGITLIVIGGKRELVPPSATATLRPWLDLRGGGVNLRLDL